MANFVNHTLPTPEEELGHCVKPIVVSVPIPTTTTTVPTGIGRPRRPREMDFLTGGGGGMHPGAHQPPGPGPVGPGPGPGPGPGGGFAPGGTGTGAGTPTPGPGGATGRGGVTGGGQAPGGERDPDGWMPPWPGWPFTGGPTRGPSRGGTLGVTDAEVLLPQEPPSSQLLTSPIDLNAYPPGISEIFPHQIFNRYSDDFDDESIAGLNSAGSSTPYQVGSMPHAISAKELLPQQSPGGRHTHNYNFNALFNRAVNLSQLTGDPRQSTQIASQLYSATRGEPAPIGFGDIPSYVRQFLNPLSARSYGTNNSVGSANIVQTMNPPVNSDISVNLPVFKLDGSVVRWKTYDWEGQKIYKSEGSTINALGDSFVKSKRQVGSFTDIVTVEGDSKRLYNEWVSSYIINRDDISHVLGTLNSLLPDANQDHVLELEVTALANAATETTPIVGDDDAPSDMNEVYAYVRDSDNYPDTLLSQHDTPFQHSTRAAFTKVTSGDIKTVFNTLDARADVLQGSKYNRWPLTCFFIHYADPIWNYLRTGTNVDAIVSNLRTDLIREEIVSRSMPRLLLIVPTNKVDYNLFSGGSFLRSYDSSGETTTNTRSIFAAAHPGNSNVNLLTLESDSGGGPSNSNPNAVFFTTSLSDGGLRSTVSDTTSLVQEESPVSKALHTVQSLISNYNLPSGAGGSVIAKDDFWRAYGGFHDAMKLLTSTSNLMNNNRSWFQEFCSGKYLDADGTPFTGTNLLSLLDRTFNTNNSLFKDDSLLKDPDGGHVTHLGEAPFNTRFALPYYTP